MPPRFAYWTILAGGLPTAFRATEKEDLLPTFRRLMEKHPDAEMRWFARGKLWASPEEARAGTAPRTLREPDGKPRGRDWRPGGTHRDARQPFKDAKREKNQVLRKERFKRKHGPPPAAATGPRPAPIRRETVAAAPSDRAAPPSSASKRPLPGGPPAARPLQTEGARSSRPLPKAGAKPGARVGYARPNAATQPERRSEHTTGHRTRSTRDSAAHVSRSARPVQAPASRSERPLPAQDARAKRSAPETRTTRPLPGQGTRPVGGVKQRDAAPKTAARPAPPRPRAGDKRDSSRWRR